MKRDKGQVRWDRMETRLNKMMEHLSRRMDSRGEAAARRRAVYRQIDRRLRSITKRLDALIAYVNRPASTSR